MTFAESLAQAFVVRFPRWQWLYFRYRCPSPIGGEPKSARACFEAGECACDNARRNECDR